MSDTVRTFSSAGRLVLSRVRAFRSRRAHKKRAAASGPRGRLFRKYVLLIVGLVSLVLLLNSAVDFWFGYEENKAALFRIQQEKAASAARRIEQFVDEIERQLGWTTAPQWAAAPLEQRRFDYVRLLRQVPPITELIQLDDNGKEQLKVSRLAMDVVGSEKDYSEAPSFTEARKHRVWFSPVYFRKESEPYMTLAMARTGRNAGVTVAEVNLKLIWDVITGLKIGQGGYAYVVDREGRLIAHPDISLVLRNTDLAALPQVAAARAEAAGDTTESASAMVAKGINGDRVLTAHAAIAPLGWTVFVELPLREALAPLYGSALRTAALLALALVLATSAALLLARRMTVPIRQLQAGAARIGAGELDRRIDIHTGDELEGLAGEFNRMAADLQKSYADLEKKVEDRTAELKETLDQQTATAEVLGVINSSPGDLAPVFDAMLEKAMRLCEAAFGMLLTFDGERFQVAAHRGLPIRFIEYMATTPAQPGPSGGQARVLRGEKIVHFADMRDDQAYRDGTNPNHRAMVDLGGARTGLVVPLRKDDAVVGTFTIYRQEVRLFSDKQIALLQNFTAQAVIAMENARLLTETQEALEQQTATAEVLQVINSSPGDLAPVFDAMLEKAMRLCEAELGLLLAYESDCFRVVSLHGAPQAYVEFVTREPIRPGPRTGLARLSRELCVVHVEDLAADEAYRQRDPLRVASVELAGMRTFLAVPLLKDDALLGAFVIYRQEVRSFSDKQIALLQNFAAQAVIAMENARLITETREALEQQTATAEVLQVINSSPGDLTPVFDAMLEKAHSLCGVTIGALEIWDGERVRALATRGLPPEFEDLIRQGYEPEPNDPHWALVNGDRYVHVPNLGAIDDPTSRTAARIVGTGTFLAVALRKDHTLLGRIVAARKEVRPFADKEIALLENFAAQAVIAMENARLLTETREALEQQTATAEVLQVINSSPGDLAPVFDSILEKAHTLCGAAFGGLVIFDGEEFRPVAIHGEAGFAEYWRQHPVRLPPGGGNGPLGGLVRGERLVHLPDVRQGDAYRDIPEYRRLIDLGGIRTLLIVPLRKDDRLLGAITAYRQEVRPFTDKQIALLQNFAAQAVIAMENARLITETREALEQQTATAEVLQVINSSPGDLAPVFDTMLDKAMRLCEASFGTLWTYDGDCMQPVAIQGSSPQYTEFLKRGPHQPSPVQLRLIRGEHVVQVADVAAGEGYRSGDPLARALVELGGIRSLLTVPLRKEDAFLGAISVYRQEMRPFSEKQIALLQNFAAQAVIAMENARLITETREALEQQTATAEVLQVINSSPGDLTPVFDAILEKAHTLCGAAAGGLLIFDGEEYSTVAVHAEPRLAEYWREQGRTRIPAGEDSPLLRVLRGEEFVHLPDATADDSYRYSERFRRLVDRAGARTLLVVPLRKNDASLGAITAYRQEVRPFSDNQIALLQNFAAQAVIAMENARLITETREALEQQTATAEVLQVINSSPGDLAPVFDAMLENALTLCDASFGQLVTFDGVSFRAAAWRGYEPGPNATTPTPGMALYELVHGEQVVHVPDITADDVYRSGNAVRRRLADQYGARTAIWVALKKDSALLGAFVIYRTEVRPFTNKQIALLQNFAAQAVIAMENARLINETQEALEQQTATAEVLQVINSSPGDLAPVFDAMLYKATRLCEATFGIMHTYNGERFVPVVSYRVPVALAEWRERNPLVFGPGTAPARIAGGEDLVHTVDLMASEAYQRGDPSRRALVELGGARSHLIVALRKDSVLLGTIAVYRQEVRPFSDKQIALLRNFAAQAVIAMENARLITETREALEQQTATAEVLQVINSSPGDLAPVFDAILEKAHSLCGADHGSLFLQDGEIFRAIASRGMPEAVIGPLQEGIRANDSPLSQPLMAGEPFVHMHDSALDEHPNWIKRALDVVSSHRTLLSIPLRKSDALLGMIVAGRFEIRPFTDKQISLLQNFAAQAVIAMENARLLTETREALEQQTATAEVLQVINSSPGDLAPVFDAMLEKAHSLCGADNGSLMTYDGERFWPVAWHGLSTQFADARSEGIDPEIAPSFGRIVRGARLDHIHDMVEFTAQLSDDALRRRLGALIEAEGIRTQLIVALRKDDVLMGAITANRKVMRPFSDQEIGLLENFAAQAVIAMENARLLTETREALEYQTATSDVLRVVSRSAFDLETVLQAVVSTAIRLCRADSAVIYRNEDGEYRWAAGHMLSPEYEQIERNVRIQPGTGTVVGRAALEGATVQILDAWTDPLYEAKDDAQVGNVHTMIGVPLLREGAPIGVIGLARRRVEAFSEREIQLVTTFADQAVIAIENARLLNDLQHRTRDLQESLEYQTATSDVLKVISRSTFDLQPVLGTVAETAARLCEADTAFIMRRDGEVYRAAAQIGNSPEFEAFMHSYPITPTRGSTAGRVVLEGRAVQIADVAADPEYAFTEAMTMGGTRTHLGVPLLRENEPIGVIVLTRRTVRPFTEKQIALVATFADQAVIAIENARLFNELRARTTELGSSVAELKMLNEVAQAVSSTLDLRIVLSTVLNASLGVTWANAGAVFRYSRAERAFRLVEAVGWDEALTRSVRELRIAETESAMGEAAAGRVPIQLPDLAQRASYPLRDITLAAGFHSALIVPLAGADRIFGAIILMRQEAGEFPPETVRLMQTIASQSVLAIQNARLFREIADKSEQLALASQHKSQFLANMSHELRTPLNAILGYAELLVDGIYGVLPDRPKGVLERIQNNGKHLLALINDVLDLAKIEAGQLTLTLEDYSLPEVVQSVVTATEPLATSKGLKFTAGVQDGLPMAHGDARRVSQVLLNLVGNAIKFTDEGEVEIRAATDKGQFVLTVRDTGPGIPDADQERIFGEFQQIDNSNTRKKGGTGLGLAISKRMVEMQGGTISVDSATGRGSTFRVVLPVHVDEMMEAA